VSAQPIDTEAFNAFEAAGWNKVAAGYHEFFESITSRVADALLDAAGVGRDTTVLDVATGPGYVAGLAASRHAAVVGLDASSEMVALAGSFHPEIDFRQGDAEQLPFADGSFDAAVGNFVVLHLGRPEQAAAEFTRVLAPGGRLALSMWGPPEKTRLLGVFVEAVAQAGATAPDVVPAGPPFFRFSDERELVGLLGDAGLHDIDVRTVDFVHRLAGPNELWEGVLRGSVRTRPLILAQTPEMQQRIRAEFDELVRPYLAPDGLEVPVSVKIASGCR
jgi:SAM-dependent methyltransferase